MADDDKRVGCLGTTPIESVVSSTSTASAVLGPMVLLRFGPLPQKPPDDHKIYSLVGRVASDWAHNERLLDQVIWQLANIDPEKGACITAQTMGVYSRCKAIIAQLTLRQFTTKKDMSHLIAATTDISNKSNGPGEKRNRIVHDPWHLYTDSTQVAQFKAMAHKEWKYGIHPVDMQELEDALTSIRQFSERVRKLHDAIVQTILTSS